MYIATKEAHHSASYRKTRRKLKRKRKDLQYDQQEDYSEFKMKFDMIMGEFASLRNNKGESCEIMEEHQVDHLLEKFQDEESGLHQAERTKWTSIFTSLELGLGPDEDLQVNEVHSARTNSEGD
jgi:hypothetical protein